MNLRKQPHCPAGPNAPVTKQPTFNCDLHPIALAISSHNKGRQQIEHDVIVIAGVESEILSSALASTTARIISNVRYRSNGAIFMAIVLSI